MKFIWSLLLVLCLTVPCLAGEVSLTLDGKVPGTPFKVLQDQIDQLKLQLQNIQLTPGPPGPTGATGVGIQGIAGPQGIQGISGTSFDLSKMYIITSHHALGICNDDDVAISCTAECSTHPDFPSPPLPFPLHGVPEEVINIPFGINFATESAYAYEDKKPGICLSKCVVPYSPYSAPLMPGTYEANVRVLCMPRN